MNNNLEYNKMMTRLIDSNTIISKLSNTLVRLLEETNCHTESDCPELREIMIATQNIIDQAKRFQSGTTS